MGHKRKREDSTAAEAPAPKKPTTEKTKSAERRQKRSERKSKKALTAKTNASTNAKKNKEKHEPKEKSKPELESTSQVSAAPEFIKASLATADNLAQGQDFVSLTESTNLNAVPTPSLRPPFKKAKKSSPRSERKRARDEKAKLAATESPATDATATENTTETTSKPKKEKPAADPRFIVFVGNLPYTTTTEQIRSHFSKLAPTSIRHSTDKKTGKSKGFAFLEFDDYSSMKTCLKVYHHSLFDPERTSKLPADAFDENGLEIVRPGQESKKGTGRRINVELTAGGGGGKSEDRKEKIRAKNTKLEEERDRRREAEMKAEKAKSKKNKGVSDANATEMQEKADDGRGDIHPSRLKRVKA